MLYLDVNYETMARNKRNKNIIDGLSERHVAQIIRRKMIQRTEPNSKAYKREKYRYDKND
jgi:hypothetical protein